MEKATLGKTTEVVLPNKWQKLSDCSKTKLFPWLNKAGNSFVNALERAGRRLLRVRINWLAILAFIVLSYMAEKGMLDQMPEVKWLIESSVRLAEWFVGLIHNNL